MSKYIQRINGEIKMLKDAEIEFKILNDDISVVYCLLQTDESSLYNGTVFVIRIEFPKFFPIKSPSVGFYEWVDIDKTGKRRNCGGKHIYHPNISFDNGSICVDVLRADAWSPAVSVCSIISGIIPHLLDEPNPDSPLNPIAAREFRDYKNLVKKYGEKSKEVQTCKYVMKIKKYCNMYGFKGDSFDSPFEKKNTEDKKSVDMIKKYEDKDKDKDKDKESEKELLRLKEEQEEQDYLMALQMQENGW